MKGKPPIPHSNFNDWLSCFSNIKIIIEVFTDLIFNTFDSYTHFSYTFTTIFFLHLYIFIINSLAIWQKSSTIEYILYTLYSLFSLKTHREQHTNYTSLVSDWG